MNNRLSMAVAAAKQRLNERGGWGRRGTTALKECSLLLWQETRGATDG